MISEEDPIYQSCLDYSSNVQKSQPFTDMDATFNSIEYDEGDQTDMKNCFGQQKSIVIRKGDQILLENSQNCELDFQVKKSTPILDKIQNMNINEQQLNEIENAKICKSQYQNPLDDTIPLQGQCPNCIAINQIYQNSPYTCYNCKKLVETKKHQLFQCAQCKSIIIYQGGFQALITCQLCSTINLTPESHQQLTNSKKLL